MLFLSTPFKEPREVSAEENKLFQETIRGFILETPLSHKGEKKVCKKGKKRKSTTDTMCVLLKVFLF